MESIEKRDLNVYVNFGLIARGRLVDILKLKEKIRRILENELHDSRIVYLTISSSKLWLVKKKGGEDEQDRGV